MDKERFAIQHVRLNTPHFDIDDHETMTQVNTCSILSVKGYHHLYILLLVIKQQTRTHTSLNKQTFIVLLTPNYTNVSFNTEVQELAGFNLNRHTI